MCEDCRRRPKAASAPHCTQTLVRKEESKPKQGLVSLSQLQHLSGDIFQSSLGRSYNGSAFIHSLPRLWKQQLDLGVITAGV